MAVVRFRLAMIKTALSRFDCDSLFLALGLEYIQQTSILVLNSLFSIDSSCLELQPQVGVSVFTVFASIFYD